MKRNFNIIIFLITLTIFEFLIAFFYYLTLDQRFFTIEEHISQKKIHDVFESKYQNLGTLIVHFNNPQKKTGNLTFTLNEYPSKKLSIGLNIHYFIFIIFQVSHLDSPPS